MTTRFIDTNVLVYIASGDARKADAAEAVLREGGVVSVQVLNELAHVARRKMGLDWGRTTDLLSGIRHFVRVEPVTEATHTLGLALAERHRLPVWDAMLAAAGLIAGCGVLLSEDFQPGFVFAGRMTVQNPFAGL